MNNEMVEKVQTAFERAWARITEERTSGKFIPIDEKDLQLHLACNLREELREFGWSSWVHVDFPIPLSPERLEDEPIQFGVIIQREIRKPDIVVINTGKPPPWEIYLVAEIKYIVPKSLIGGYWMKLLEIAVVEAMEGKVELLRHLGDVGLLDEKLLEDVEQDVRWYVDHGSDMLIDPVMSDLKKVHTLMSIYSEVGMHFPGYVCVMDEIYGPRQYCYKELMKRHKEKFPGVELRYFSTRAPLDLITAFVVIKKFIERRGRQGNSP